MLIHICFTRTLFTNLVIFTQHIMPSILIAIQVYLIWSSLSYTTVYTHITRHGVSGNSRERSVRHPHDYGWRDADATLYLWANLFVCKFGIKEIAKNWADSGNSVVCSSHITNNDKRNAIIIVCFISFDNTQSEISCACAFQMICQVTSEGYSWAALFPVAKLVDNDKCFCCYGCVRCRTTMICWFKAAAVSELHRSAVACVNVYAQVLWYINISFEPNGAIQISSLHGPHQFDGKYYVHRLCEGRKLFCRKTSEPFKICVHASLPSPGQCRESGWFCGFSAFW